MKTNSLMRTAFSLFLLLMVAFGSTVAAQEAIPAREALPIDRTVLPIPEPQYPHSTVFDVRNATPPERFEVRRRPMHPMSS